MMFLFLIGFRSWTNCPKTVCALFYLMLSLQMSFHYAHSATHQGQGEGRNTNSRTTDDTQVQTGSEEPCCSIGTFYSNPKFFDLDYLLTTTIGDTLKGVLGLTLAYCVVVPFIDILLFKKRGGLCHCDCQFAHGASDYKLCDFDDGIPCLCKYSEADLDNIPGSLCSQDTLNHGELNEGPTQQLTGNENEIEGGDLADDLCPRLFSTVIQLACDDIDDNGNGFYTVDDALIFPADICSIDCYYTHGSRSDPPYGVCCSMKDKTTKCICLNAWD